MKKSRVILDKDFVIGKVDDGCSVPLLNISDAPFTGYIRTRPRYCR